MESRGAAALIRAALRDTPVVVLHGARQTGKSTLAKALAAETSRHGTGRRYVTLDDAPMLSAAASDAAGFIGGLSGSVIIDEAQRVPELFLAIKASIDRDRKPGRFLLTGSANVLLTPRLSDSLAGRMELITLWPLSQSEIDGSPEAELDGGFIDALFSKSGPKAPPVVAPSRARRSRDGADLLERIVRGGYPEPLQRPAGPRRAAWYGSYLSAILDRDVRDMSGVEGLTDLPNLLTLIASRAAGLLSYADLSRGLSMPASTLKRYFALLEATFLVVRLPAWTTNRGLRLTKSPKVLLADTGLACHLLGADRSRLEHDGNLRGSMLENFVVMELMKQTPWSRSLPRMMHFRTVSGQEADLVLEDAAGRIVGIEVKATASPDSGSFTGLRALAAAAGDRFVRGVVLHTGPSVVPFGERLTAVPIEHLWQRN